jgi:hypothetical protein
MAIDKTRMDQLLKDYKHPEEIIGENGLPQTTNQGRCGAGAGSRDERASGL